MESEAYNRTRAALEAEARSRVEGMVSGGATAVATRSALLQVRRELKNLRSLIVLDMKEMNAAYRMAMGRAAGRGHPIATLIGGRRVAGRLRADERFGITKRKNQALAPYEESKLAIDQAVAWLDQLIGWVDEERRASS